MKNTNSLHTNWMKQRWGLITQITLPGGGKMGAYDRGMHAPEP